jgi:hypothetical protein
MACIDIGHTNCNYQFNVVEREGHKAPRDAWQHSKNKDYLKKIAAQEHLKMQTSKGK